VNQPYYVVMRPSARKRFLFVSLAVLFLSILVFSLSVYSAVEVSVQGERRRSALENLGTTLATVRERTAVLESLFSGSASTEEVVALTASIRQGILVAMDQHSLLLSIGSGSPEFDADLSEAFGRLGVAIESDVAAASREILRSLTLVLTRWEDLRSEILQEAATRRTWVVTATSITTLLLLVGAFLLVSASRRLGSDLTVLIGVAEALEGHGVLPQDAGETGEAKFAESETLSALLMEVDSERRVAREVDEERGRKLGEAKIVDPLTGARTRQAFLSEVEHELARCKRYERPLSFVGLDIEHLASINHAEGTSGGDYVLSTIADILKQNIRASDWTARIGDDSFGLMLPETPREGAEYLAEKLRRNIEIFPFDIATTVRVRCSVVSRDGHESADKLITALEISLASS
jgi:diguanylate cyclase (GGDEF)-like protein